MNNKLISRTFIYLFIICWLVNFCGSSITAQSNIEYRDKSVSSLKANIEVQADKQIGVINPDIYGLFMEMCYYEFNGGIWAEMLKSRKFAENDGEGEYYGVVRPWFAISRNENTHFAHDNSIYYCGKQSQKIINENKEYYRCGIGQDHLYFEEKKGYQVRINLKQKDIQDSITIALEGENGIYVQKEVKLNNTEWNRFSFPLNPKRTDKNGKFTITFYGSGTLWVGSVSLMADDNISGFRQDVVKALTEMRPPNIRWPGGNMVSVYRWDDGIGDRDKRPPRFIRELWEPNDVGINEFMELCHLIGTRPYIALNAGDGTPEEAARLVEYCIGGLNTKYGKLRAQNGHPGPYHVKLWGIGNEMFGNWQNGHVDEETYARRHVAIAKAILEVDKDIKIIATGGRYWKYPRWNQALFNIAGEYFDYLSLHSYAKKYRRDMKKEDLKDPNFAEEFYYYIVSAPYGIEEQIIETDKEIRNSLLNRPKVKIAFDEWNCWAYRTPFELVDFALRDGLYTAGVFHAFRRQHKAMTLANFSKVVNAIAMIRVNQSGMFLNPQYLVFRMYLNHSGLTLLGTDVHCDSFPVPEYEQGRPQAIGCIPYLDVSATMSEDEHTVYVAVINLHIFETIKTEISIKGWESKSNGKIIWLDGEHYMTENTFENPDNVTIKEKEVKNISSPMTYIFPPHSVTILKFYRK
ncbi:MAG TPA: alpha-L-arabinofuranosidase C-terminal domain-containing protein [bacterium]